VPNSLNSVIASGNLLSASSWVCWRTQPWYHLAEIYTDPSGCGKKENLSSLRRLVMRTPLYLIQRSLIEDLKCIAHVKILTFKLQLKTSSKCVHNIQISIFHRNAIHVRATNAHIRCSMYSVISLSAHQTDVTYRTQIWMLFPLHWACSKSDWYWKR